MDFEGDWKVGKKKVMENSSNIYFISLMSKSDKILGNFAKNLKTESCKRLRTTKNEV